MGVDCKVVLPNEARLRDVSQVIALLLGKEGSLEPLGGGRDNSVALRVKGVRTEAIPDMPECVHIRIDDAIAGEAGETRGDRRILYHFEFGTQSEGGRYTVSGRGIMPSSTPLNVALCVELAKFFGGRVDFNDCDNEEADFEAPTPLDVSANDGALWNSFQRRMAAVQPLTPEQIAEAYSHAAYKP